MYRARRTGLISDRMLLIYTVIAGAWLFALSFFDHSFVPDPGHQTIFFAAINSVIPQTGIAARIIAFAMNVLVAVAVYFANQRYFFIRSRTFFPIFCIVLIGGMFPYQLSADAYCQLLILLAIVRFLDSYDKREAEWNAFQVMFCVSTASLISPSYFWYILIFYAGFIIYNKFSWTDFFASLFGVAFPLLIALLTMIILGRQELLFGFFDKYFEIPEFNMGSVLHLLPQAVIIIMSLISFTEFIIHYSNAKIRQRKSMSFLYMFLAMVCGMFYFYPSSLQIQGNTYAMLSGICISHFFATNKSRGAAIGFYVFALLLLLLRTLEIFLT